MANMELITSVTVGSGGAASVTLPATGTIPQTYTDLKIVASARGDDANPSRSFKVTVSNATTYATKIQAGDGTSDTSSSNSYGTSVFYAGEYPSGGHTASTFSNTEIYIANYTSVTNKSASIDSVDENNATTAYAMLVAALINTSSAITTITISASSGNFAEGSTFYLYGITNVTSTTKATGGIVSTDGTYNYHMFPFSGTFTPTVSLTADVLQIAGGAGGAGDSHGGGGGAGGYRLFTSQSLTATGYPVVVGAGGAGGGANNRGTSGSVSSFNSNSSSGGGGGGVNGGSLEIGLSGGSGGGSAYTTGLNAGGTGNAGSYSPVEGFAGGGGQNSSPNYGAGGGGGAGAVGGNGTSTAGGLGGVGVAPGSTWAITTGTGANNGYYAGGGSGSCYNGFGSTLNPGGLGGGGKGHPYQESGLVNTGGGGGGAERSGNGSQTGGSGGSGIVIIRYAI